MLRPRTMLSLVCVVTLAGCLDVEGFAFDVGWPLKGDRVVYHVLEEGCTSCPSAPDEGLANLTFSVEGVTTLTLSPGVELPVVLVEEAKAYHGGLRLERERVVVFDGAGVLGSCMGKCATVLELERMPGDWPIRSAPAFGQRLAEARPLTGPDGEAVARSLGKDGDRLAYVFADGVRVAFAPGNPYAVEQSIHVEVDVEGQRRTLGYRIVQVELTRGSGELPWQRQPYRPMTCAAAVGVLSAGVPPGIGVPLAGFGYSLHEMLAEAKRQWPGLADDLDQGRPLHAATLREVVSPAPVQRTADFAIVSPRGPLTLQRVDLEPNPASAPPRFTRDPEEYPRVQIGEPIGYAADAAVVAFDERMSAFAPAAASLDGAGWRLIPPTPTDPQLSLLYEFDWSGQRPLSVDGMSGCLRRRG